MYSYPDKAFTGTKITNNYPRLSDVLPGYAQPLHPIDLRSNIHPKDHHYFHYSRLGATDSLDLTYEEVDESSVFPRSIYARYPFANSVSYYVQPRDKNLNYTYSPDPMEGKERSEHTMWQSRFGYDLFPNEYGVGMQSRGYIEPPQCHICDDVPHGVAPERFYLQM